MITLVFVMVYALISRRFINLITKILYHTKIKHKHQLFLKCRNVKSVRKSLIMGLKFGVNWSPYKFMINMKASQKLDQNNKQNN